MRVRRDQAAGPVNSEQRELQVARTAGPRQFPSAEVRFSFLPLHIRRTCVAAFPLHPRIGRTCVVTLLLRHRQRILFARRAPATVTVLYLARRVAACALPCRPRDRPPARTGRQTLPLAACVAAFERAGAMQSKSLNNRDRGISPCLPLRRCR